VVSGNGQEASLVRNPYDGHEHSWYWPSSLPCPRHCYRCGIQHPDDATPPLVAAPPVPPVTDDEAALAALVDARLATKTEMRSGFYQQVPRSNAEVAVEAIAGLRSAGFLIVHHTKET
jgi:hypothetical protein